MANKIISNRITPAEDRVRYEISFVPGRGWSASTSTYHRRSLRVIIIKSEMFVDLNCHFESDIQRNFNPCQLSKD